MNIEHTTSNKFHLNRDTNVRHKSMPCLHTHGFYEVYYLLEGKRKYFLDNAIYKIESGDVVLVPPNVLHRSIEGETPSYSRILLDIPKDMIEKAFLEQLPKSAPAFIIKIPKKRRDFFENLLEKLEYEFHSNDDYSDYLIKKHLNELFIFLIRLNRGTVYSAANFETSRMISNATRYISGNFEKQLTLEEVAENAGMSKSHFCRLFKEKTGFNFSSYLTGVRINEAAKMLCSTDLSITEIASQCGYNDSAYFAMIFKKIKGTTPLKYRNSPEV